MHKIILRSLGYCLLMTAATISQMIAPPIGKAQAVDAVNIGAASHAAPGSNAADFRAELHRNSPST